MKQTSSLLIRTRTAGLLWRNHWNHQSGLGRVKMTTWIKGFREKWHNKSIAWQLRESWAHPQNCGSPGSALLSTVPGKGNQASPYSPFLSSEFQNSKRETRICSGSWQLFTKTHMSRWHRGLAPQMLNAYELVGKTSSMSCPGWIRSSYMLVVYKLLHQPITHY